jgi:hypothetical protein
MTGTPDMFAHAMDEDTVEIDPVELSAEDLARFRTLRKARQYADILRQIVPYNQVQAAPKPRIWLEQLYA